MEGYGVSGVWDPVVWLRLGFCSPRRGSGRRDEVRVLAFKGQSSHRVPSGGSWRVEWGVESVVQGTDRTPFVQGTNTWGENRTHREGAAVGGPEGGLM